MPFDPTVITEVRLQRIGSEYRVSWTATSPPGTVFQIYVDQELVWADAALAAMIPLPDGPGHIDIGAVLPDEKWTSFAASLPAAPKRRVKLKWYGGMFEGADIAGFHVYGEPAAGVGVDYASPLATITAYPQDIDSSGFGLGGFGSGGFGFAAATYSWTSVPLASGQWTYAVKPFDEAGNEGEARTAAEEICAPPREVPPFADGTRLHYLLSGFGYGGFGEGGFGGGAGGLREAILTWQASPG